MFANMGWHLARYWHGQPCVSVHIILHLNAAVDWHMAQIELSFRYKVYGPAKLKT